MNAVEPQGIGPLINMIYEAALDSRRWTDFLMAFARRLDSSAGMIYSNDFDSREVEVNLGSTNYGFDPAFIDSFASYYGGKNVWLEDPRLHEEGRSVTDAMLYPPSRLKATEYWTDWLRPQDMFHTAAAIVEKRNNRSVNLTVLRSEQAGAYTDDDMAVVKALMPHLQTGFSILRKIHRLEALTNASANALETFPLGVVLLDERAKVLHANALARTLTSSNRLLRLSDTYGMNCARPSDDAVFQRLIHQAGLTGTAAGGGSGGSLRLRGLDGEELQVLVTPFPSWATPFGTSSSSAVFINDPRRLIASLAKMLSVVYGMTPAEARLTQALVSGSSPAEFAERQGVSINTVRTQIKSSASKVGATRQSDLVRIVLTGPAMLRLGEHRGRTWASPGAADDAP